MLYEAEMSLVQLITDFSYFHFEYNWKFCKGTTLLFSPILEVWNQKYLRVTNLVLHRYGKLQSPKIWSAARAKRGQCDIFEGFVISVSMQNQVSDPFITRLLPPPLIFPARKYIAHIHFLEFLRNAGLLFIWLMFRY